MFGIYCFRNIAEYLECGTILDLCTESSDLSGSITLDHLKEDLNLVTDEDLTDLLRRECNEPEDTANVRCAQIITVLSNNISKISLLILKAMNKKVATN